MLLRQFAEEVAELGQDQARHGQAEACSAPGRRENRLAGEYVPAAARVSIAAAPISSKLSLRKSSPNPGSSRRLKQCVQRVICAVASGDAGSSGRDDEPEGWLPAPPLHGISQDAGIVRGNPAIDHAMAMGLEQGQDGGSACVVLRAWCGLQ